MKKEEGIVIRYINDSKDRQMIKDTAFLGYHPFIYVDTYNHELDIWPYPGEF